MPIKRLLLCFQCDQLCNLPSTEPKINGHHIVGIDGHTVYSIPILC